MNDRAGHIKEVTQDDNNYRQFIINCYGENDQRKYFSLTPFGIDFVAPENTRSFVSESANKDVQYNLGVLNKIKIDDLAKGESVIFSTDETGEDLKSSITLRNTGNIEVNKNISENATVNINADGTIEFNGNVDTLAGFTELKAGFDQGISDLNDAITRINDITTLLKTWTVTPQDGGLALKTTAIAQFTLNVPSSNANIDNSKKENIKVE